jgi:hypothetical protein
MHDIDCTYADLAIVLLVSWACGIVEAGEANLVRVREGQNASARSDHAKIRSQGRCGQPHQYGSTSRGATCIFSSFELCDSCNCTYTLYTLTSPNNTQQWLEVVASVAVSLPQNPMG